MVEATLHQGLDQTHSRRTGLEARVHLDQSVSTIDTITAVKEGQDHRSGDSQMATETGAVTDVGLQSLGTDVR